MLKCWAVLAKYLGGDLIGKQYKIKRCKGLSFGLMMLDFPNKNEIKKKLSLH